MTKKDWDFPVYRKYKGINTWFKITGSHHFIEIKQLGSRYLKHEMEAKQYPEMVLIQDMLTCHEGRWEIINPEVVEALLNKV